MPSTLVTPQRIVSLLPYATEMVAALGCQDRLVGRSHECDFPESMRSVPICSEPRFDMHGGSRDVQDQVERALRDGLSIFRVDAARLDELQPDLIITQTQCAVCAVSLTDVEQAVQAAVSSRPRLLALESRTLDGVWHDFRRVAEALGLVADGERLIAGYQARLRAIASARQTRTDQSGERPGVACIEWLEPLMSAGNWVPELVSIAGGRNLLGTMGEHSPWMDWHELEAADPDVIVVIPCGWGIDQIRKELPTLANRPEWQRLRAVTAGNVFLADGNQYFNRPGPRLVESAEILAEILNPEQFPAVHQGTGWQRLGTLSKPNCDH